MELAQQLSNCQNPHYFPTIEKGSELGIDQCFICQTVDHMWMEALGKGFEGSLLVLPLELPL